MTKAAILGLPMSLDAVAKVLKLDEKKDAVGSTEAPYNPNEWLLREAIGQVIFQKVRLY